MICSSQRLFPRDSQFGFHNPAIYFSVGVKSQDKEVCYVNELENVAQKIGYIEGLQAMHSSLTIFRSSPTLSLLVIRKICVF